MAQSEQQPYPTGASVVSARIDRDIGGVDHAFGIVHQRNDFSWSSSPEIVRIRGDGSRSDPLVRVTSMHVAWGDASVVVDAGEPVGAATSSSPAIAYATEPASAVVVGGSGAPSWLGVDAETGSFSGTAPETTGAAGTVDLQFIGARTGLAESRADPVAISVADARVTFDSSAVSAATYAPTGEIVDTAVPATNPSGNAVTYELVSGSGSGLSVDPATGVVSGVRRVSQSAAPKAIVRASVSSLGRVRSVERTIALEPARFIATRDSDRDGDPPFDVEQPNAAKHPAAFAAAAPGDVYHTTRAGVPGSGFVGDVGAVESGTVVVARFRARESGAVLVVGGYITIATAVDGADGAQTVTAWVPGVAPTESTSATLPVRRQGVDHRWVSVAASRPPGSAAIVLNVDGAVGASAVVADSGQMSPAQAIPNATLSIGFDPSNPQPFDCDISHVNVHAPGASLDVASAASAAAWGVVALSSDPGSDEVDASALETLVASGDSPWGEGVPPALAGHPVVVGPSRVRIEARSMATREYLLRLNGADPANDASAGLHASWSPVSGDLAASAPYAWGEPSTNPRGAVVAYSRAIAGGSTTPGDSVAVPDGFAHVVVRDIGAEWPASGTHDPNGGGDGTSLRLLDASGGAFDATGSLVTMSSEPAGAVDDSGSLSADILADGGAFSARAIVERDGIVNNLIRAVDVLPKSPVFISMFGVDVFNSGGEFLVEMGGDAPPTPLPSGGYSFERDGQFMIIFGPSNQELPEVIAFDPRNVSVDFQCEWYPDRYTILFHVGWILAWYSHVEHAIFLDPHGYPDVGYARGIFSMPTSITAQTPITSVKIIARNGVVRLIVNGITLSLESDPSKTTISTNHTGQVWATYMEIGSGHYSGKVYSMVGEHVPEVPPFLSWFGTELDVQESGGVERLWSGGYRIADDEERVGWSGSVDVPDATNFQVDISCIFRPSDSGPVGGMVFEIYSGTETFVRLTYMGLLKRFRLVTTTSYELEKLPESNDPNNPVDDPGITWDTVITTIQVKFTAEEIVFKLNGVEIARSDGSPIPGLSGGAVNVTEMALGNKRIGNPTAPMIGSISSFSFS